MGGRVAMIQQMLDAADDRARADVLLRCPDSVILKYSSQFADCCRRARFEAGEAFVQERVAALLSVRDAAGLLPARPAAGLEEMRAGLARFAAGEPA